MFCSSYKIFNLDWIKQAGYFTKLSFKFGIITIKKVIIVANLKINLAEKSIQCELNFCSGHKIFNLDAIKHAGYFTKLFFKFGIITIKKVIFVSN
jgi:hypothetical protein